ncbi:conserved hypothetical protein [Vibrio nigripulchritudo SFn27]|uniref:Phytase-like domain-containing protein n=1 Tax=Vibrio nigripulchritudo TaxID=28173 RepID=U4KII1_9VIBR|nr:hypothetical protein [Vibrio nigripulchritudo]KJY67853.1 hypothetical protein TW74_26290 [Vibrio nigripulchritudo]CCN34697.1 conserved hypothetical protein [Vibrio nigripulchritudo AM115]CCN39801.1 conserved hypothetical protein [Vibrio nigripulchritudo FTn2]CCN67701.1 conserved hypothetical protein [Vibrio nigripulchritudo POn4]CCN77854.1 conserved hypothetical protein [Vibrio nigripulchritudo SO65]
MKKGLLLTALSLAIPFTASSAELTVTVPKQNKEFPSASGIVYTEDMVYAVGDDSPWLYKIGLNFRIADKDLIKHYPVQDNGRIVKKVKPDFEAMELLDINGKPSFVMLGSGSKAGVREWAFVVSQDKALRIERSLEPLYAQLYRASRDFGVEELNIEGLAASNGTIFILNRGNGGSNVIFTVPTQQFEDYLTGKTDEIANLGVNKIQLPEVGGFEAGLSGATYWEQTDRLVFTASVEATGDAYNDGEILGSFVGSFPINQLESGTTLDLTKVAKPVSIRGKQVITKVESVSLTTSDQLAVKGVLASDNDDGTSEFFKFRLTQ